VTGDKNRTNVPIDNPPPKVRICGGREGQIFLRILFGIFIFTFSIQNYIPTSLNNYIYIYYDKRLFWWSNGAISLSHEGQNPPQFKQREKQFLKVVTVLYHYVNNHNPEKSYFVVFPEKQYPRNCGKIGHLICCWRGRIFLHCNTEFLLPYESATRERRVLNEKMC
jgi:hypothetical protein